MKFSLADRRITFKTDNWYIAENAVVIGDVVMEDRASIWFGATVRGDSDTITIGENANVQDGSVLHTDPGYKLTLGRNVSVGHLAMLHGCIVDENTLIGIKAVVLNGATIGKNCIIGANALVTEGKTIPDNSMVLGSPGKIVRTLEEKEIQHLRQIADHYSAKIAYYRQNLKPQA
jgi:carbonic anhydrase/acetyltransferase-like protein (isoleucine patch superfamily)